MEEGTKSMKGGKVRRARGQLQREVLRLLYTASPRGVRELQKLTGHSSPSPIQSALKALEDKGYVEQREGKGGPYAITMKGRESTDHGFPSREYWALIPLGSPLYMRELEDLAKKVEKIENIEGIKDVFLGDGGLIDLLKDALRWRPS